jgi:hypothetical protein
VSDYPVTGDPRPNLYVIEGGGEGIGLVSQDDYTPATVEESLQWCLDVMERFYGHETSGLTQLGPDGCEECERFTVNTFEYGLYRLCRRCVAHRLKIHARLIALDEAEAA